MNKIVELGLSYHDIAFGKEVMPTLFAKQRENGRAYRFVITDLNGFVSDLSGLILTMEIGLGTKRQAVEGKNLSLEQDGAFVIEIPTIYDYGRARYSLTISDGEKKLTTKNGNLFIEQSLIFDDGEGGDISFDLIEFQKAMGELEQSLKDMDNALESSENTLKAAKQALQAADDAKVHILEIEESLSHIYESEQGRVEAEEIRVEVEKARVAAEDLRVKAENARVEVEKAVVAAETGRVNAENERVENETLRKSNEVTREDNEKNRVSNHTAMQESIRRWSLMMQDWIAAEESRVLSESTRKDLFNQMKKEFDEMMEILGDNPVGNLTQEIQELKNVTDKHFKSAVIQGDDLVLIREDMTELVVPLELNKYATVKALEELETLLTSTKTQLEMKIGKKADKTYVDSELEKKANAADVNSKLESKADLTYVDEKLLNKADTTDLDNFESCLDKKVNKSDIVVIQDGEVEPQLSDGQILIICEVE